MDLLGKLDYQPLFRKWTRGPPCSEDRKRRQPTYRVVYDFALFRCLSSLRKYHFWVSYVLKQLLLKLTIKVPVQKKTYPRSGLGDLFLQLIHVVFACYRADGWIWWRRTKASLLGMLAGLSFFIISSLHLFKLWRPKLNLLKNERWFYSMNDKGILRKILESTLEIASEKIHISKRNFCLFFATTL